MNESLKLLYKNKIPSSFRNVSPTLLLLGFIDKNGVLTPAGNNYAEAILKEDYEKARKILSVIIIEIDLFKFIISKLESLSKITTNEIGNMLKERYAKKWEASATKTYGKACASLIAFSRKGNLVGDTLTIYGETTDSEEYPVPSATFNDIFRSLKSLHRIGTTTVRELSSDCGINEKKLPGILNISFALNLVNRFSRSTYAISKNGEKFIDPSLTDSERKEIFTDLFLNSQYISLLQSFDNKQITPNWLGEKMKHDLKKEWSDNTVHEVGEDFLNLLKKTNLLIGEKKRWKLEIKKGIKTSKINKSNILEISKVWKHLGAIQVAVLNNDDKSFNENLANLQDFSIVPADLLELIKEHYNILKESELKDPNIILKDLELLENKIKENLDVKEE